MPAKSILRASSLASQLLQRLGLRRGLCRSRLAGEGDLAGLFRWQASSYGDWGCVEGCVGAGLPAKAILRASSLASQLLQRLGLRWGRVGAGLPAKAILRAPSLASQLLQ
nr:hypothetical protein FFPRI1PSEUD_55310 [Pseudomonas sp. FFPRI_1]